MEDIFEVYKRTLEPLSLFKDQKSEEKSAQRISLQRPITPINDEIKRAPTVFDVLADHVRRRVKPDAESERYLDFDEQEHLAAILISEVRYLWPEFRMLPQNPFLSAQQNRELRRRIAVHVVTTCQILFRHYLRKLQVLNERGVFNSTANIVRLKAQLADDAHGFLNIQIIRRHILEDIKNWQPDADQVSDKESVLSLTFVEDVPPDLDTKPHLTFMDFLNASRPQICSNKKPCTVAEESILDMLVEMPHLDTGSCSKMLSSFSPLTGETVSPSLIPGERKFNVDSKVNDEIASKTKDEAEKGSSENHRLRRTKSLTEVPLGNSSLAEFDGCRNNREENSKLWHGSSLNRQICTEQTSKSNNTKDLKQFIKDDLQKLASCENLVTGEDDIPPLIQFLHSNSRNEFCKQQLETQLKALEEREKMRKEKETLILQKNLHAQPSFITKMMSKELHVRTSDVRISDRISLSPMTLKKYDAVYNHLSGEIDVETWKRLDANLFLKEEMTDVFEEIMKTMPSDHLLPECDIHVEPGPDTNEIMSFFSTSYSRKVKNQIISQHLKLGCRSSGQTLFVGDNLNRSKDKCFTDDHGLLSNSVQSWLTWWKNTVNSDDYMKFLSTQDTDYLGVLFQFYNSDDAENEERIQTEKRRILENEKKVKALVLEKVKYEPGLWNANSVLLGGLGQRPTIDSQEENVNTEIDKVTTRAKSHSFVQTKGTLNLPKSCHTDIKPIHTTSLSEKTSLSNAQERLEHIWELLQMPESIKLDMTIKYSLEIHFQKLDEALDDWEMAANMITERENVLGKLEKFERSASDPARLLGRASRVSKQLEETCIREGYNRKLSAIEFKLKDLLARIDKVYQDVITYQGRSYIDKMEADRTEMLFWLQEERKKKMIEYESRPKQLPSVPPSLITLHPVL